MNDTSVYKWLKNFKRLFFDIVQLNCESGDFFLKKTLFLSFSEFDQLLKMTLLWNLLKNKILQQQNQPDRSINVTNHLSW